VPDTAATGSVKTRPCAAGLRHLVFHPTRPVVWAPMAR
jgi:hypothetical protein